MTAFTLYTIPGSPCARAVLATLIEKGASFRVKGLTPGSHRQEPHLSRHPFGKMPVLEHGDFSLYETQAILRYLDRQLPAPCLTPTDVREAARMDQIMGISDWYLFQRVSAVICFQRVIAPRLMGIAPDEAAIAKTLPFAHTTFGVLNRFLRDTPFLASGAVTLADLLVVPHIDMLSATPEWGILTRDQPDLVQWLDRMNARASLRNTTWDEVAALAKQSEEPLATAGPRGAEEQVTR